MAWITGAAIIGGSLLSGALQSDAAGDAASEQRAGTEAGIAEQARQYNQTRTDMAPWRDAGATSVMDLLRRMGLPGNDGAQPSGPGAGDLSRRFSINDFWQDPVVQLGYQSGLDLGTRALRNRAPLTTGMDSGAALKELTQFGTDYTGQKAGESYNRFENDKTSVFNKLAAFAGIGQTAANTVASTGANTANNISGMVTAQGNANAASRIGQANAWSGALGNVANWWQGQNTMDRLERMRGGYGYYSSPSSTWSPPGDWYANQGTA